MRELSLVIWLVILDLVVVLLGVICRLKSVWPLADLRRWIVLTKSEHVDGILCGFKKMNGVY